MGWGLLGDRSMIDVHILTYSGTRKDWMRQCLSSLEGQPCVVHVIQGFEGDIASGRILGFSAGSNPYVAYVDCDDWVLPGAMDTALRYMQSGLDAIITHEEVWYRDKLRAVHPDHHLFVARRDVMSKRLIHYREYAHRRSCVPALRVMFNPVSVPEVCYAWRMDGHETHRNQF